MNLIRTVLTISVVLLMSTIVCAAPASEESVERLIKVTQVQSTVASMANDYEEIMRQGLEQSFSSHSISVAQQKVLDRMVPQFAAMLRDEMDWGKLKPMYIALYRETFDQSEVNELIEFYKSAPGQAFVKKMPMLTRKTMALTQSHIQALVPKIKTAVASALVEARNAN